MAEERKIISDLKFLQQFWSAEALERTDKAGQKFAKGASSVSKSRLRS
ncbi:hypothetical protein ACJ7K1_19925 [Paenibacillus elgii]